MDEIKVFAPASVANVSCGYDIFGFALHELGDEITLTKRNDGMLKIVKIEGAALPLQPGKNVATVALASFLKHVKSRQGFDLVIKKNFPPCSGLGSSACSAAGTVVAANALLGNQLSRTELIPFAMAGEKVASQKIHADNIAPSLLGGFTVVRSCEPEVDVFQIEYPDDLYVLIIFPQVKIKTSEATQMLGNSLALGTARKQWGNVAGLVAGLMSKNWNLIQRSMIDEVAEPLRKKLIPHYDQVRESVLGSGAVGFNISGSGPSMFAFYRNKQKAKAVIPVIQKLYDSKEIEVIFHTSEINKEGTVIMDQ